MKAHVHFLFLPLFVGCQKLSKEENSLLQQQCGKPVSGLLDHRPRRSMYAQNATRAEAPWVAGLHFSSLAWRPNMSIEDRETPSINNQICSASLISSRHILTAAHCIVQLKDPKCTSDGELISTEIERRNIDRDMVGFIEECTKEECENLSDFKPIARIIKQIFYSNKYTSTSCEGAETFSAGDIAVVELAEDVRFSDLVYPVCLNDQSPKMGDKITLFGYGTDERYSSRLRTYTSKVTECEHKPGFDNVCSLHETTTSCQGDSGGGRVVYDRRGAAYVAAVNSGSLHQCRALHIAQQQRPKNPLPNHSTDVSKHLMWICAATGICANKEVSETVKAYEEKGLTDGWYNVLKPFSGNDV